MLTIEIEYLKYIVQVGLTYSQAKSASARMEENVDIKTFVRSQSSQFYDVDGNKLYQVMVKTKSDMDKLQGHFFKNRSTDYR